jgi:hypothetical protein
MAQCDETRPSCMNCTKHGVQCSFPRIDPKFRFLSTSLAKDGQIIARMHVFPQMTESPPLSLPPPSLLDILAQNGCFKDSPDIMQPQFQQILHHFMQSTSATITPPGTQSIWTGIIPQIAATNNFVLRGIFAVGSLHFSRCVGIEKDQSLFLNIAAGQLSIGLSRYQNVIQNITEENAEALFSFSSITTSFMLIAASDDCKALLQLLQNTGLTSGRRQKATNDLVFATAGILRYMRGVLNFLVPYWFHLMDGHLAPLMKKDWWPSPIPTTPEAIKENRTLHDLERVWMRPGRKYEYYFDALRNTLKTLQECFALVSQLRVYAETTGTGFDWSSVISWLVHCSFEFIELLERQQSDAWMIMAHYAILLSRLHNVWWLENLASNIVATAAYVLGESKWSLIEWPASVVGIDLKAFRDRKAFIPPSPSHCDELSPSMIQTRQ